MVVQHNWGAAPSTLSIILGPFWGGYGGLITENLGGVPLQSDSVADIYKYVNGGNGGRGDFSNDYGEAGTAGGPGAAYVFFYYR
jgi:hypothetical protein